MRLSSVVLKPVVTEKSMALIDNGRYVFRVAEEVNAGTIKKELKKLYNVDVVDVRVIILPGKKRRMGKTNKFAKTAKRKKLIVTLKEGQKIDILPKELKENA